jgi:hypothetical protein
METAMRSIRTLNWLVLVPVTALTVACGRGKPADDTLKNDLALASQAAAYNPQQFVSPAEAGYLTPQQQYVAPRAVARQPVSTARRTTTARRSTASSAGSYPQEQRTEVVKHTHRDAAIGAAAGAIIGAVASKDKVKGGLIGAGVGGIIGAVIGNNVDVQRRPVP